MIEVVNTYEYISKILMVIMVLVVLVELMVATVLGNGRIRFMWPTIESTIGCCEQRNESSVST